MLYIVATPIGNLGDITLRALEVLKSVDTILAEDTRVTKKLLNHYKISAKLESFHEHSSDKKMAQILSRLQDGEDIAYVTDAGTPGVSDPGGKLVSLALKQGIKVVPIPGASAVSTVASVAGLKENGFLFVGFLPHKKGKETFIKSFADSKYPIIFYEAPTRLVKTLQKIKDILGNRQVLIGRELTKKFEEIYKADLDAATQHFNSKKPRGELTVVLY